MCSVQFARGWKFNSNLKDMKQGLRFMHARQNTSKLEVNKLFQVETSTQLFVIQSAVSFDEVSDFQ